MPVPIICISVRNRAIFKVEHDIFIISCYVNVN